MSAVAANTLRIATSPIRCVTDEASLTWWCHMHGDAALRAASGGRDCFTPHLVAAIGHWQQGLAPDLRRHSQAGRLPHVVLASDSDVFNLGGDLALFSLCIRTGDRARLLDYARQCVLGVHSFHAGLSAGAETIALVQGDALGGGFEAALSCHTIVAEDGVGMGLPEILFDLFPGMGAYSFLSRRIGAARAERMLLSGDIHSAHELHAMGVVDVLVPRGQGRAAVEAMVRRNQRTARARGAVQQVREIVHPISLDELMRVTEIWVDTALALDERALRTMERLVRAQQRRSQPEQVEPGAGQLAEGMLAGARL